MQSRLRSAADPRRGSDRASRNRPTPPARPWMPSGPAAGVWSALVLVAYRNRHFEHPLSNHDEGCPLNLTLSRRFCDRRMTAIASSNMTNSEMVQRDNLSPMRIICAPSVSDGGNSESRSIFQIEPSTQVARVKKQLHEFSLRADQRENLLRKFNVHFRHHNFRDPVDAA